MDTKIIVTLSTIFLILFIATLIFIIYTIKNLKNSLKSHVYQYKDLSIKVEIKMLDKIVSLIVNDKIVDEIKGFFQSIQLSAEVNGYRIKVNIAGTYLGKINCNLFINDEKISDNF